MIRGFGAFLSSSYEVVRGGGYFFVTDGKPVHFSVQASGHGSEVSFSRKTLPFFTLYALGFPFDYRV